MEGGYWCGRISCTCSFSGITLTEGKLDRNILAEGVSLGPGPELEYNNGNDSRPHKGSSEGWRVVVHGGGAAAAGGDTAGSGGDRRGSSGRQLLLPPKPDNKLDPIAADSALEEGEE